MTAYTTLFPAQHGPALQSPGIARRPTTAARPGYQPDFASLLRRFEAISLSEMSAVALQDRMDTKFVMREAQLYNALATLTRQYRVLDICGVRLNHYRTLYFDTDDFALFQQHHTGRRDRYKVRTRSYVDSQLSFLEVKHKVRQNRTVKNRIATPGLLTAVTPEADAFLNDYLISSSSLAMLLVANGAVLALLFALEREWGFHFSGSKRVMYDRIDLISPAHEAHLLADLRERTGLMVERVDVRRIDVLHDTAGLVIYYEQPRAKKAATAPRLLQQRAEL